MTRNAWPLALALAALAAPAGAAERRAASDDPGKAGSPGMTQDRSRSGGPAAPAPADPRGNVDADPSAPKTAQGPANQLSGTIQSLDKKARTVTLQAPDSKQVLKVPETATVFVDGRIGSFQDLKEGQQVRAAWEQKGGDRNVRWLEVRPSGATWGRQPDGAQGGTTGQPPSDEAPAPGPRTPGAPPPDVEPMDPTDPTPSQPGLPPTDDNPISPGTPGTP